METVKTGSCLCGDVSYELQGALRPVMACHCMQCRKTSGHYWAATSLPNDKLTLIKQKSLKWFASSEQAKRGFCQNCGASLFWQWHDSPNISVAVGTINGTSDCQFNAHIFTDYKGDYYTLPPNETAYSTYPHSVSPDTQLEAPN